MMVIPAGVMPDKPMKVDTLVSVLKARLRGEKDVSVRRYLRKKILELTHSSGSSQSTCATISSNRKSAS